MRWTSIKSVLLLLSLAFLGGWVVPSPAQGSCGHYVIVGGKPAPSGEPENVKTIPGQQVPHRLPCSGPHCKQTPGAPTPGPTQRISSPSTDRAWLQADVLYLPLDSSTLWILSCSPPPSPLLPPLERPPR